MTPAPLPDLSPAAPARTNGKRAWVELDAELTARRLTIADLARSTRLRYDVLSQARLGYAPPSPGMIARIAGVLGIPPEAITPASLLPDPRYDWRGVRAEMKGGTR